MINHYIIFRSLISIFFSFFLSFYLYKWMIIWNKKNNFITENIRHLGIKGEKKKIGIPTMGGLIIIISTLIPTVLFSYLNNIYIIILIITTVWMGLIGFLDDFIKIKYNKNGLSIIEKILGQIIIGVFIGAIMYFNPSINRSVNKNFLFEKNKYGFKTTIPRFFKKNKNEFNYSNLLNWFKKDLDKYTWIIFIPVIIFIIVFISNGSNITDGIDGLTAGVSLIILVTLILISIISSNKNYSSYLHCIYVPNIDETIIFSISMIGSLIGFLWYNTYPAQIFMGDTGSLTLGGIISVLLIMNRIEFIFPILCGIFLVENLSVIIQVLYFKYTKIQYKIEKKFFLMSPIHHHFQKLGYHENKICIRFIIFQIILSILSIIFIIM
ncbi:phospho-N-acetylmuramoyl-pentapeptide-transferase [Blattabacterium cuenoti]|uniref:phospho-N-acetylmuramoyl-pentapeptide- transferase n=1 Tax=Blattabacterium cuenoti TaxID=1653831 RepID=UPI00163C764E|nr:phospho-N-acetylmuramoyl-pentapeptide-transferase [Blattabacterium cuenoti]